MDEIVIDQGVGIVSKTPVTQIARSAAVCTVAEFQGAGNKWEKLVQLDNWDNVSMELDTVLFSDALEGAMGRVQLKNTGNCVWDRAKLLANDDFKTHMIKRAIPCDGGQRYVVGVFSWK